MSSLALQRSIRYLESRGWHVGIMERWLMGINIRKDFLGLADAGAVRHDFKGTWYFNACDLSEVDVHITAYLNGGIIKSGKKIGQTFPPNPHLPVLLCGNRFSIFAWGLRSQREEDGSFKLRKDGKRLKRKEYILKIIEFYLDGAEVKWKKVASDLVFSPPGN
jgi:hypothetical protein